MATEHSIPTNQRLMSWAPTPAEAAAEPAESAEPVAPEGWYASFKFVGDFVLALILFALALPLLAVLALLVRLTSRGPALYSQVRLGRNGRPYWIHKLRTMTH